MYKIGDFSKLSKTTIKALRYYEKEKLLIPIFVDQETGYRYYETNQLIDLSRIISLRQVGMSIKDIKKIINGYDIKEMLQNRKTEIKENLNLYNSELSKINYLLECENMKNEIIIKEIPSYVVYYKEGVIENFSKITEFILSSADECLKTNPNIKCINPNYCYVNYLDWDYRPENIKIRYAQAVEEKGIENETIKFMNTVPVTAVCTYHKGRYDTIRDSYNKVVKYIEDNNYEIIDDPRECYIDGCWNKEKEEDYLTEIQFPVKKKK